MSVNRHLLLVLGDNTRLGGGLGLLDRQDRARELSDILKSISRRVTSLRLVLVTGEEDDLALVLLKPLDVKGEGFLSLVATTVVNTDSNALGELGEDTGTLEREKREKRERKEREKRERGEKRRG